MTTTETSKATDNLNSNILGTFPCTEPGCEHVSSSKQGIGIHRSLGHGIRGATKGRATTKDAIILYEAMTKYADGEGRVMAKLPPMLTSGEKRRFLGNDGLPSEYKMRQTLHELVATGCVQMNGNRVKILIRHPDGTRFNPSAARQPTASERMTPQERMTEFPPIGNSLAPVSNGNGYAPRRSTPDQVDSVPPEILADSIARTMWERYEWALSEIGKAHAMLEVREAEIHRLRLLVETQERRPGVTEAAKMILHEPEE